MSPLYAIVKSAERTDRRPIVSTLVGDGAILRRQVFLINGHEQIDFRFAGSGYNCPILFCDVVCRGTHFPLCWFHSFKRGARYKLGLSSCPRPVRILDVSNCQGLAD